ncbi:MAG: hypothetical protein C5B59_07955 [Bacteroidetes bacterium]|nr:MAG: hypothetical protein C5B59_07955 [Bacteroidota bacterium]
MIPTYDRLLVKVDPKQKSQFRIGDTVVMAMNVYEVNYREKSPVIGEILGGNEMIEDRSICVFHHNHFYGHSPYFVAEGLYSVPFNHTILGVLDTSGLLHPVCGNLLCDRVVPQTVLPVNPAYKGKYIDRAIVTDPGWTDYQKGETVFTRTNAAYEIVYNFNGTVHRIHKVHESMIVGRLR